MWNVTQSNRFGGSRQPIGGRTEHSMTEIAQLRANELVIEMCAIVPAEYPMAIMTHDVRSQPLAEFGMQPHVHVGLAFL